MAPHDVKHEPVNNNADSSSQWHAFWSQVLWNAMTIMKFQVVPKTPSDWARLQTTIRVQSGRQSVQDLRETLQQHYQEKPELRQADVDDSKITIFKNR